MKLENYFFVNNRLNPSVVGAIRLAGNVFGREGVEDGHTLYSSSVVRNDGKTATTFTGSVYELGKMHPDYTDLLKAIENDVPIISQCGYITNENFPDGTTGLQIDGEIVAIKDGEYVHSNQGHWFVGKIIGQKENFLTIRCYEIDFEETDTHKDITAFIVWPEYFDDETGKCDLLENLDEDYYDSDFEETFLLKCRPKLKI